MAALVKRARQSTAEDAATALTGPTSVENQLDQDEADRADLPAIDVRQAWEGRVKDGWEFNFGIYYNALGFTATEKTLAV